MSEDAVVDWESTIHKNVESKDGQDAGNVDAIEGNTLVITSEGDYIRILGREGCKPFAGSSVVFFRSSRR